MLWRNMRLYFSVKTESAYTPFMKLIRTISTIRLRRKELRLQKFRTDSIELRMLRFTLRKPHGILFHCIHIRIIILNIK
jgi:hypothetical protein